MRACGQKFVKFCTLTHAAKLVVEIFIVNKKLLLCNESPQLDSAVEEIRTVGGPEVGWCGRTVARRTVGVGEGRLGCLTTSL